MGIYLEGHQFLSTFQWRVGLNKAFNNMPESGTTSVSITNKNKRILIDCLSKLIFKSNLNIIGHCLKFLTALLLDIDTCISHHALPSLYIYCFFKPVLLLHFQTRPCEFLLRLRLISFSNFMIIVTIKPSNYYVYTIIRF